MNPNTGLPTGFLDLSPKAPTGTTYGRIADDLDRIARDVDNLAAQTQDLLDRFAREHNARAQTLRTQLDTANRNRINAVRELRRQIAWPRA